MSTAEGTEAILLEILGLSAPPEVPNYGPNDAVSLEFTTPYPPIMRDLTRLYDAVRSRRCTTILEFGSGYSTAVLAAALKKNQQEFLNLPDFRELRRNNPFELHSVDGSQDWLDTTRGRIPEWCRDVVHMHRSDVSIGTFGDRLCHYYDSLPNICPDFIYLDGPMQHDVHGDIAGLHFRHNDRTVVAADIARMEWTLLPGTLIIVDGRTNNSRFLRANFQREWSYRHDVDGDAHTFELVEPPLGEINRKQMAFAGAL